MTKTHLFLFGINDFWTYCFIINNNNNNNYNKNNNNNK